MEGGDVGPRSAVDDLLAALREQKSRQQRGLAKEQELLQRLVERAQRLAHGAALGGGGGAASAALAAAAGASRDFLLEAEEAWKDYEEQNMSFAAFDALYASLSAGLAERQLSLYSAMLAVKAGPADDPGASECQPPEPPMVDVERSCSIRAIDFCASSSLSEKPQLGSPVRNMKLDSGAPTCSTRADSSDTVSMCSPCFKEDGNLFGSGSNLRTIRMSEDVVIIGCSEAGTPTAPRSLPWQQNASTTRWRPSAPGGHVGREMRMLIDAETRTRGSTTEVDDEEIGAKCGWTCSPTRSPPTLPTGFRRCLVMRAGG